MGAPLVFGKAGSTAGTIDAYVGGFKIPSPMALFGTSDQSIAAVNPSTCPESTQVPGSMQVPFGYDISTGCTLSLTRTQLQALCCEGSSASSSVEKVWETTRIRVYAITGT